MRGDGWGAMMDFLVKARNYLWLLVELAFVSLLAIILIYLILGQNSGTFVLSVADNVTKFANAMPTASLIGLAVLLALIVLAAKRLK